MHLGPGRIILSSEDLLLWCPTAVAWEGRWWLFHSRWSSRLGHQAWVTHSSVGVSVADDLQGPFAPSEEILTGTGGATWDGGALHNPMVIAGKDRLWMFFMANHGGARPGQVADEATWWEHRNHQRIGVAWATHPRGPWQRVPGPVIGPHNTPFPTIMASNPSVTFDRDGGVRMIFKCVEPGPPPFGGRVVHLMAEAERPEGPYRILPEPVLTAPGVQFPAEDPTLWQDEAGWQVICKDMRGSFSGIGTALVAFRSDDGRRWVPQAPALVSGLTVSLADGTRRTFDKLERPAITADRRHLLAAALTGDRQDLLLFPLLP